MSTKTLTIERPGALNTLRKLVRWDYSDVGAIDLRKMPQAQWAGLTDLRNRVGGSSTTLSWWAKGRQIDRGVTVCVDQRVSRDLEVSTVAGSLENLVWPGDSVELRWQDGDLPGILLVRCRPDEFGRGDPVSEGFVAVIDAKDGSTHTLAIHEGLWQSYLKREYDEHLAQRMRGDVALSDSEGEVLRYMVILAVKVLAYASVARHAPALLTTRGEQKEAGIHPKHAPIGRAFVVRYLPRVTRDSDTVAGESEGSGGSHRFLGRAGHVRYYGSERYKNVRGTWQWLPPIAPPEGVQVTYRVRQAPADAVPVLPGKILS